MRTVRKKMSAGLAVVLLLGLLLTGCQSEAEKIDELLHLGNQYLDEGDFDNALLTFNQVFELDVLNVPAHIGVAKAKYGQGDVDGAFTGLWVAHEQLLNPPPEEPESGFDPMDIVGGALTKLLTREEEAPEPQGPPPEEQLLDFVAEFYVDTAEDLLQSGEQDRAIELLEEGYDKIEEEAGKQKIGTTLANEYLDVAARYLEEGDYEKALEYYQKALALIPDDPRVHSGMAEAYARMGDLDAAKAVLDDAGDLFTEEERKQLDMEMRLAAMGDLAEANGWTLVCADVTVLDHWSEYYSVVEGYAMQYLGSIGGGYIEWWLEYVRLVMPGTSLNGVSLPVGEMHGAVSDLMGNHPALMGGLQMTPNEMRAYEGSTLRVYGHWYENDRGSGRDLGHIATNLWQWDDGRVYLKVLDYYFEILYIEPM